MSTPKKPLTGKRDVLPSREVLGGRPTLPGRAVLTKRVLQGREFVEVPLTAPTKKTAKKPAKKG